MSLREEKIINEKAYAEIDEKRKQQLVERIESSYLDVIHSIKMNMSNYDIMERFDKHIFEIKNAGSVLNKDELSMYMTRCQSITNKLKNNIENNIEKEYSVNGIPVSRIRFQGHEEENRKTK